MRDSSRDSGNFWWILIVLAHPCSRAIGQIRRFEWDRLEFDDVLVAGFLSLLLFVLFNLPGLRRSQSQARPQQRATPPNQHPLYDRDLDLYLR